MNLLTMATTRLTHHPIFQMMRVGHHAIQEVNTRLVASGRLSTSLQRILFYSQCSPGVTQVELAEALGYTGAAISRQVKVLTQQGYLARTVGADRRQFVLSITPQGEKEINQALDIFLPVLNERIAVLSKSEQSTLKTLIAKLSVY